MSLLVYMDRELPPISRFTPEDLGEQLVQLIDFHEAGKDRRRLAEKMVHAQITLAQAGYSTGGRPPYGFDRWLVRVDGTRVRRLEPGERVRMNGHHVAWLPADDERLEIARWIRESLLEMPASRVARLLNERGIPSPDAGRMRRDHGVRHPVRGMWNQTTVVNIGRSSLLAAIIRHGLRSMGDRVRFKPTGPREDGE